MKTIDYLTGFENDCLDLYATLGSKADSPEMKELYTLLTDNRQRHMERLGLLKEQIGDTDYSEILERAGKVMNGCRRTLLEHDLSKAMRSDSDAFDHVIHSEEEMIRMCEGVARAEKAESVKKLLNWFVEDEKQHLEEIESIYEFVEAPRCYLEWGEFSNMRTL